MSKVLIVYPHGLGDCILATPAIREYKKQTDNFIGFATLERFRSAELFKNNPYVDEIIYTKDAWDYGSFQDGLNVVREYCDWYAKENKYDEVKMIQHSSTGSKITDCFWGLNVGLNGIHNLQKLYHTEVYLTDEDREWAYRRQSKWAGFVHSETGVENKNLPDGYGRRWLSKHGHPIGIEVNEKRRIEPIARGFAALNIARAVVVADSVYYHAAGAMDKDVDLAYFARGGGVYNRVKPLHKVKQNIVYELEDLDVS